MTELNQIRELEKQAHKLAELKAPKESVELVVEQMMTTTMKYLGITNEYKEDLKEGE